MNTNPQKDANNQKAIQMDSDLALHVESLVEVDNPDDFAFEGDFQKQAGQKNGTDRKHGFTHNDNPDDVDANLSKS
jgi:hypothetical protein